MADGINIPVRQQHVTSDTDPIASNLLNAFDAGANITIVEVDVSGDNKIRITASGAGMDTTAIHDNVAAEISAITAKVTPVAGDFFIIEDSAAADVKKSVTFSALETALNHDSLTGFVVNEHIDHSTVTLTAGSGLAGGGDITANRTFDLDINSLTVATVAAGDFVPFWDITATATNKKTTFANFEAAVDHNALLNFVSGEHFLQSAITTVGTVTVGNVDAVVSAASLTLAGKVELATVTETNTGTDATRAVTPDGLDGWTGSAQVVTVGTVTTGNVDAVVSAASLTLAGKVELTTTAEIDTGTDSTRAMPIDQFVASDRNIRFIEIRLVESTTSVATGTSIRGDWRVPFAGTIIQLDGDAEFFSAYNDTAGITGTMIVDVHKNGTTIMTTNKLDIETTEKTTATAATQPDLTTTAVVAGDILTFDIDAIHSGTAALGLVVRIPVRMT